ncbi:hypothetical protein [Xanthomonas sp. 60]
MNVADAIRQTRPAACVQPPPPPAHGTGLSPNGLQNIPPAGQHLYHEVPRARLIGTASGAVPERATGTFRPSTIATPTAAAWRQPAPPPPRQREAADSTTQAWWDDPRAPLPVATARRLAMEEEAAARGVHPKHVKDVDDHLGVVKARIDSDRRNALSRLGRDLNDDLEVADIYSEQEMHASRNPRQSAVDRFCSQKPARAVYRAALREHEHNRGAEVVHSACLVLSFSSAMAPQHAALVTWLESKIEAYLKVDIKTLHATCHTWTSRHFDKCASVEKALKRLTDAIGYEALATDLKLALVPALMRSLENRGHLPIYRSLAPALSPSAFGGYKALTETVDGLLRTGPVLPNLLRPAPSAEYGQTEAHDWLEPPVFPGH